MFEIKGKFSEAKVFVDSLEQSAMAQIYDLLNHPAFGGSKIRIMLDCHAGEGCVIGFTADMNGMVVPNLVGVDISCGMYTVPLGDISIDYAELDSYIRNNIPYGTDVNAEIDDYVSGNSKFVDSVKTVAKEIGDYEGVGRFLKSVGSLGGGNHFIEVSVDSDGKLFLVIHSGSRNFGYRIAGYHQRVAIDYCLIENIAIPASLSYLVGSEKDMYLEHMHVAEVFAEMSRKIMANRILNYLGIMAVGFTTTHNYFDVNTNIIRKGAINAEKGKDVLIPLNMRDGSILAVGKGNEDWNCSAPHGAGRIYSRSAAKATLSMEDFIESMQGIYSTSVKESTLDESPMAYKPAELILNSIGETVEIVDILKPVYNFKA